MTYSYVTVSGSFATLTGSVTFTPPAEVTDLTGTIRVQGPGPFPCTVTGGSFTSVPLLATDNRGLLPAGWNYTATVALTGQQAYTYPVLIPAAGGSTATLSALPVSAAGGGGSFGDVTSVTAGDASIAASGTAAVTLETGTLDQVANLHPPAADWSNNGHAITAVKDLAISGLTGATTASRYAGATAGGAPTTGAFSAGDYAVDLTGSVQICSVGGTPGTWATTGGLIAQQTLAGTAASITFTGVPQTYTQLRLVAVGASNTAAENTRWQVRVNGDGGSNYDNQMVQGVNTTANGGPINTTQQWIIYDSGSAQQDLPGANATSGVAGILEVVIPGYSGTTFHKIGMWRSGYTDAATAAADASVNVGTIAWRSTAAVTSLTISAAAGSFVAGTFAYLYGS